MDDATAFLVTVTGRDRPGLTSGLCDALEAVTARILDIEQVTIRDRLVLGFLVALGTGEEATRAALEARARELGVHIELEPMPARPFGGEPERHYVTILGQPLRPGALARLTGVIAAAGSNIDRIVRLSRYPILSFELLVSGGDPERLRRDLVAEAPRQQVDVAVQRATLYRRAKRLIVLDVDSTLVQGEVIERLAVHAGREADVADLTRRAMAGELEFGEALRERLAVLEGLPASVLDDVRDSLELTPGARTLVRTLKRLGFVTGIVSGGFTHITDELQRRLGIDFAHANSLEVRDGRLTGRPNRHPQWQGVEVMKNVVLLALLALAWTRPRRRARPGEPVRSVAAERRRLRPARARFGRGRLVQRAGDPTPAQHQEFRAQRFEVVQNMARDQHAAALMREVAEHVHVSPQYFCKFFKKATGIGFSEFLARVRVENAKDCSPIQFYLFTRWQAKPGSAPCPNSIASSIAL